MSKRETIEEFLARGGTITKVEAQEIPQDENRVVSTKGGGAQIMSLHDGGIYYAEGRAKKAKPPIKDTINLAVLPAHLLKFIPK